VLTYDLKPSIPNGVAIGEGETCVCS